MTVLASPRKLKKAAITLAVAVASFALAPLHAADDPLKVGFVYVGPIGDHGWTYRHDVGRVAVEEEFGDKVETTYVESVPEGADAERVIRKLASDGHDLIFTTSFGYMNPTLKVAKAFPNVKFEHATGYKRADNLATYSARFYEGRAVIGTMAGMITKTNVVGYIASFPIPEVIRGINAFTIAMRRVNPDAEVKVVWVNTWYDPGKEADAAKTLIDQGADIITQHTDSPAPLQAAQERGVVGFGQASDVSAFAPDAQLTSIIDDWNPYYIERTKAALEGTWESQDTWHGIDSGMVGFAPYGAMVPDDVKAAADDIKEGIIDGSIHAFQGPIKNQAGEEVLAEGEVFDDGVLLGMDFYVEGVQGTIPK
jgi:simple sugar transport system substrate-binding protein